MSPLTKDIQQAVFDLARVVELTNVRVVEFGARLLEQAPATTQEVHVEVDSQVRPGVLSEGFVVEGQFKLKARTTAEGTKDFLELNYRVGAVYRLPSESLPPINVLKAFAETNGMVHLWPYVRAYVQQTCAQLGVPIITLPPFRVVPKEAAPEPGATSLPQ
jgi:preprotein translocase subunit SecB